MLNRLWHMFIRYLARSRGFLDPVALLSRLDRLAQPAEVRAPVELLRAGARFHARGLINSRVVQNNLNWIWPYWVQRQFDPADDAFVPRGFNFSHVNQTLRNWTAVGLPDCNALPIVDPRGLLTPFYDGWSLDACVLCDDGTSLFPSRCDTATQALEWEDGNLRVVTETGEQELQLRTIAEVVDEGGSPVCRFRCEAESGKPGWLAVSLRPWNPEGISFVHEVELQEEAAAWGIDGKTLVQFPRPVQRHLAASYSEGDVLVDDIEDSEREQAECDAGLTTAAALWPIDGGSQTVSVEVPLENDRESRPLLPQGRVQPWDEALAGRADLDIPDEQLSFLYESAIRTLILHSPGNIFPGPYTYKRFWYRDAAFMIHSLLCVGLTERARRALRRFPEDQRATGFFHSQNGEWDSNGQALWTMWRYCELTGQNEPPEEWKKTVHRGARWIARKRCEKALTDAHAGLLPAGFSAEHFGNNDYYYWDDFWAVGGLRGAADMCSGWGEAERAAEFRAEADDLMECIERSLAQTAENRSNPGFPASPYRRMDGGSVGSLVAAYPLQLIAPDDSRVSSTVDFLRSEYFMDGAYFHHLAHSGINAYLTLHIAQAMLREGNEEFLGHVKAVADLASPTGQWPEAIHPRTGGGCMGDGQHAWAAAEWIMMIRNMFIREEGEGLVLGSGMTSDLIEPGETIRFGPTPTPHGGISVVMNPKGDQLEVSWEAEWRDGQPPMEVRVPGFAPVVIDKDEDRVELRRAGSSTSRGRE